MERRRPTHPRKIGRRERDRVAARMPDAHTRAPGSGPPEPLVEIPSEDADAARLVSDENSYLRTYRMGPCRVLVTREYGRWHLSVSHPSRLPTWDEVVAAWYQTVPPGFVEFGAMALPARDHYLNHHPFCLSVYEVRDPLFGAAMPWAEDARDDASRSA